MPIAVPVRQRVKTEAAEPRTVVRLHTFGYLDAPIWFLLHRIVSIIATFYLK